MTTIPLDTAAIHVPEWVNDLASFRRWVLSDEFGHPSFQLEVR